MRRFCRAFSPILFRISDASSLSFRDVNNPLRGLPSVTNSSNDRFVALSWLN